MRLTWKAIVPAFALVVLCSLRAPEARAQDGARIASGILGGIARGLNGGGYPTYPGGRPSWTPGYPPSGPGWTPPGYPPSPPSWGWGGPRPNPWCGTMPPAPPCYYPTVPMAPSPTYTYYYGR